LLIVTGDQLKLYLIEDMSQAPSLLACFLLPVPASSNRILWIHPLDNIVYSSRLQMQAGQTMWTSDPKDRLLVLNMAGNFGDPDLGGLCIIISTRIFFFRELAPVIPWIYWGPLNTLLENDG